MLTHLDITFLFQYVYILAIGCLYITEVIVICQRKNRQQFNTPFYVLFVVGAFLDINFEVLGTIIHRLPMSPLVNGIFSNYQPSCFMTVIFGVAYYLPAAQEYLNGFIALNRLTAIIFNSIHDEIWKRLLPVSIVIIVTAPIASVWYMFFCPIVMLPVQENNYTLYILVYDSAKFPTISVTLRTAILVIGGATSCFVLYSITALWMRCVPVIHKLEGDKRLFYFGFTLFVLNIPCAALQLYLFFLGASIENLLFAYKVIPWLIDIKSLLPPILLFVFNRNIRRKCYEFYSAKRVAERHRGSALLSRTLTNNSRQFESKL